MNLEQIKARCVECGDCWEWSGSCNPAGGPKWTIAGKNHSVRRLSYVAAGKSLSASQLLTAGCGNPLCVNPAHTRLTTKAEIGRKGDTVSARQKRAVKLAARKRQESCLTMEIVRRVRSNADGKSQVEWARELGICSQRVSQIQRNVAWRDYSNPFAGLMR